MYGSWVGQDQWGSERVHAVLQCLTLDKLSMYRSWVGHDKRGSELIQVVLQCLAMTVIVGNNQRKGTAEIFVNNAWISSLPH